jgi:dipeptidyl aminopeptidase/acylaminoacyl peptidase
MFPHPQYVVSMKNIPYGSWRSPITSDLIVAGSIGLGEITLRNHSVFWLEQRPQENGRSVIVRQTPDGKTRDIIPAPFNVRTRVHEYGGGAYLVDGERVYFSNFADQRIYRLMQGAEPDAITPEGPFGYADAVFDASWQRLICVREDHSNPAAEPVNALVGVSLSDGKVTVLTSGADFYSNPRISPDGRSICWLCWRHPNLPWDRTELWVASLRDDGQFDEARRIAGESEESIFQPEWSPDGTLHFVSDRSGWWNLYRWHEGKIEPVAPMAAEFGEPQWIFRQSTYVFASAKQIICTYSQNGLSYLARIDTDSGRMETIETPYTDIGSLQADGRQAVFLAASPNEFPSVVRLDLATGVLTVLKRSSTMTIEPGYLAAGDPIEFPTKGGLTAYGFFYSPTNAEFAAPPEERPPLLVISHGGPTSAAHNGLKLAIQFFTSRGFAVLDVNYGGSTGFGRAYRERLKGQWGVVDVDDCVNGALYLAEKGLVDRNRLAIRGGSAGGFTTLAALAFRDVFKAGASHYGVSDLEALARDTHKFESRYLDTLIGPYPDRADLYRQRSPIHAVERLSCPMIFFQGLEDKVVPPNQAERMVEALKQKGLPVAYLAYEGEQHGFRQAKNIKRTLDAELYFYSRIFGFTLADPVEPVAIDNLD